MDDTVVAHSNAMLDEFLNMEKRANKAGLISRVGKALTKTPENIAWAGRGGGALAGAGVGAGLGAAQAEEGQRGMGALVGGLTGAGLGLGAGQFATQAGRGQARRFGQRQLHSMTGYLPGQGLFGRGVSKLPEAERQAARMKGLREMRMTGSGWRAEEAKRLKGLGGKENKEYAKQLMSEANPATFAEAQNMARQRLGEGFVTKHLAPETREKLVNLKAHSLHAPRAAAESGATSIPGVVRGAVLGSPAGHSRAEVLRAGALGGGGLGLGLGTAFAAGEAPSAAMGKGEYKDMSGLQRAGKYLGQTAGWTFGSALPMVGSMGLGSLGGTIGQTLGKGTEAAGRGAVGLVRSGLTPGRPGAVVPQPVG